MPICTTCGAKTRNRRNKNYPGIFCKECRKPHDAERKRNARPVYEVAGARSYRETGLAVQPPPGWVRSVCFPAWERWKMTTQRR